MDDRSPYHDSPLTTLASDERDGPLRVQFAPNDPVPNERLAAVWIARGVGLFPVAALTMLALGVLARHGVPVPALGYQDTLLVLSAVQMLLILMRRARWYA